MSVTTASGAPIMHRPALRSVPRRIFDRAASTPGFRIGFAIFIVLALAAALYPELSGIDPTRMDIKARLLPPLLIGGGAPNSSLMAGALVAFIDRGIEFDVISTSGAGALMGLLYTAPQGGDPRAALSRWADIGVADAIYDWFPVNYKVFMKPGVAADMYRQMLAASPFTRPFFDAFAPGAMNGLWADWVRLFFATMSPTDLTPQSLGLCAHLPFAEQAIDFAKVPGIKPEFYINAYNMTQEQMTIWGKDQITPEHLRAAFSFPFIYPPTRIGSDDYIEGAAIDIIEQEPGQPPTRRAPIIVRRDRAGQAHAPAPAPSQARTRCRWRPRPSISSSITSPGFR